MSEWSNLTEEARKQSALPGPKCSVGLLLKSLSTPDRAELNRALGDPGVTSAGLSRILRGRLADAPSTWSIGNHRRNECACSRSGK